MRFGMWMLLGSGLVACTGDTDETDKDTGETDADADADTDADADADADTDSDADTDVEVGEVLRKGAGTADIKGFTGTETLEVTGDRGYGDVVCTVVQDVNDINVRKDCKPCEWAYDVELTNARIVDNVGDACDGLLTALSIAAVSELDGEVRSMGMVLNKAGHIPYAFVSFNEDQKRWRTFAEGDWDVKTGDYDYERFFGKVEY
ncbi:MAG: hypothetical protein KTR31_24070 [Myxococcales bacterium]|nr:hypothetical protein [Myxococcales bacterium]